MNFFSAKHRPFHLGPFPLEKLRRNETQPDLSAVPSMRPLDFSRHPSASLAHAMARFQGMLDTVRDGRIVHKTAEIPTDPRERADHMKAAAYYFDASMVGIAKLGPAHFLAEPIRNPMVADLKEELEAGQPKSFASGVDAIYADVLESAREELGPVAHHTHALMFLVEYTRDPKPDEAGTEWFVDTQAERAALLTSNVAVVIANYIRMLGHEARAHTATTSDVDLGRLAVSSGLCAVQGAGETAALINPFVGSRFGLAAVTTTLDLDEDLPLGADAGRAGWRSHGPDWWMGRGTQRRAGTATPYKDRDFRMGPHPFETIKRTDKPTTFIDEERVPRFPKRADFFARALFGDIGRKVQEGAKGGMYVMKSPIGACARRALGALLLLQFGEARGPVSPDTHDPQRNADNLKAASYYLSADAVGLSRVPDWAYYSHDAGGNPIEPYHDNGVSLLLDQGFDTMEGASGDDWISVAQSMRAYLRFSLLGGVIGEQVRRLGYSARVHSVLDGDVLQPPLLLLSGLGEVSRIGEVILNPFLGPRLKSGVVTTSMPMVHDKPIDFGLQHFCNSCNKCARECPSGAITAGPKLMYNGYEIWKSDAEKCARYRITNAAGGMCGRCMKTCPWNLEGLFADEAFRWLAINAPASAKTLAALDDRLGRGEINPVKKWWWDIELNVEAGRYVPAAAVNERGLSKDLKLHYADQTLAVYPADMMPPPYPVTHPLDRETGIERYRSLLTPEAYREKLSKGETEGLAPKAQPPSADPEVFPVVVSRRTDPAPDIVRFELERADGKPLPKVEAGAHVDVVIAPEYQRQYSLAGDPADADKYVLGVQREEKGRGGSLLMHRVFKEGRRIFISKPRNHFPLDETAQFSLLMAGGIGVTPLMTMAHRLHALGKEFILHYSAKSAEQCGFADELKSMPWSERVFFHFSGEGRRARLSELVPQFRDGFRLYTCGADRYMDGVFDVAAAKGWPEEALLKEYFSVPETPDYVNHDFTVELARSGRELVVTADQTAADALNDAGIHVDVKCTDGLCGVCAATLVDGQVEHRDHVLSAKERKDRVILCCSRAAEAGGKIRVDL
ncbi:2Fe-2S iron-sulfur cluster-binding protein [Hoeflea prorocentri]|uniref:2Fe-2S iron-sulfur cluster-binding protein n=1 Tax=Hoeflea prorocentri TaxID=1922333 RepID=A0A9X3ZHP0_9HYPH|nr:2Fe-2S iron-sulfur cluster-binding protein [Hoeflea prorocentri]MCY6381133.1 2Fe-2S iron-sulfur cluster-binding protein [Hoeflea prorocentri]MDA5398933.1 2Fe-2S iron-sulfur cluster-binding protein [Hoeflea prorocentri]